MGACVQPMMHNIPNLPSPEGASFVYLQDKLSDLRGQYYLLAHKYNEMVRGLQECQNALHGSLKHIYELERSNVKLQEQQKQTVHANQETNEQDRQANQAHAPLSMIAAWQRCSNKSLGQQCVLRTSQEGGGQNVICTQCLKSTLPSNIFLDPTNIEPEANHSFISPCSANEMPDLDKGQADSDFLMPFIPELGNNEALQPTDFSSCVSWPYQENIFPNALSEAVILHPRMFESLNEWPVSCAEFILGDHQSDMHPNFSTESCFASLSPSNKCAFEPEYLKFHPSPLMPAYDVNATAEIDNGLRPLLEGTSNACLVIDRVHSPCCKVSACDLTSNKSYSAVPIKGCKSMEQQSRGQWRSFLSDEASPFCQCEPVMNGGYESFRENIASSHSTHLQGYLGDEASATPRSIFRDKIGQFALSFPTCISIRADCHNPTLNCLSYDENASVPSSVDYNKPCGHHHCDVSIQTKVHEHTKLVALAGNLACLAFPQGTYKTEMCNKWLISMGQFCPYGHKCQFAHGSHELRPVLRHPRYKTNLCRMVAGGKPCPYGHRCHFRHVAYPHEVDMFSLHSVREPTQF